MLHVETEEKPGPAQEQAKPQGESDLIQRKDKGIVCSTDWLGCQYS